MDGPDEIIVPLAAAQEYAIGLERLSTMDLPMAVERVVRLRGPLDVTEFGRAFQRLLHDNLHLRVGIDLSGSLADAQRIDQDLSSRLRIVDLADKVGDAPTEAQEVQALLAARDDVLGGECRPFEARLLRFSDTSAILYWHADQVTLDGLSNDTLPAELLRRYGASSTTEPTPAGDRVAHARAQHEAIVAAEDAGRRANGDYWCDKLSTAPLCTQIPDPDPRWSVGAVVDFSKHTGTLNRETTIGIDAVVSELQCSLHAVLIAGLVSMVHLTSGVHDVLININLPTRSPSEMRRIGRYNQLALLRVRIDDGASFDDVVTAVKVELNDLLAHRKYAHTDMLALLAREARAVGAIPTVVLFYDGVTDRRSSSESRARAGELTAIADPALDGRFERALEALEPPSPDPLPDDQWTAPYVTLPDSRSGLYYFTGFILETVPSENRVDYTLRGPMSRDSLETIASAWSNLLRSACAEPGRPIKSLWYTASQRSLSSKARGLRPEDAVEHRGFMLSPSVVETAIRTGLGLDRAVLRPGVPSEGDLALEVTPGTHASLPEIRACIRRELAGYLVPNVLVASDGTELERFDADAALTPSGSSDDPTIDRVRHLIWEQIGVAVGPDDDLVAAVTIEPWFVANVADVVRKVVGREVTLIDMVLAGTLRELLAPIPAATPASSG